MITITVLLAVLITFGAVLCILPVLALPLLDIVVGALIVIYLVKIIKKLCRKKKDKAE